MNIDHITTQLEGGKKLPLAEDFYTIQGEGFHTGKPAYFIRLGGCDAGCKWCDAKETWNPSVYQAVAVDEIIARALSYPAQAIVVTGGEPLLYPLDYLTCRLKEKGMRIFLETSGSHPFSGHFDWVCLSPKKQQPPLEEAFNKADELKVIIQREDEIEWAEACAQKVPQKCLLYLQPEWSVLEAITPVLVDYVKNHPVWNLSLQTHKFIHIP